MSKLNFELKTGTNIKVTTSLRRAIGILQLNNQELESYLHEIAEENPMLELSTEETYSSEENSTSVAEDSEADYESSEKISAAEINEMNSGSEPITDEGSNLDSEAEESLAGDLETTMVSQESTGLDDYSPVEHNSSSNDNESDLHDYLLNKPSTGKDLKEHLFEQIPLVTKTAEEKIIANYLLESIDERGYIAETIDSASQALNTKKNKIDSVLRKLQTMEPTGVFARDLQECLRLQLEDKEIIDNSYEIILQNLDMVAECKLQKLANMCDIDLDILREKLAEIRKLNPKPGLAYSAEKIKTKIPDIYVYESGDKYSLQLNDSNIPKAIVNKDYYDKIKSDIIHAHEKDYVKQKYNEASALVKAITQRQNTLLRIARVIVEMQKDFLKHGIMFLEPLVISRIAKDIDMHESTVSRVINNKFIATPRGTFAFKFFFSSSLKSSGAANNKTVSSTKAKELIKEMIDNEGDNILSDEEITSSLDKFGINISRRAVAKYRSAMNIPSSSARSRKKSLVSN
jgi:RNA polymerase sigma-54 factor